MEDTYPSPSKEGNLKGILKENKVDEIKNKARAIEPEKVIARLHHRHSLHHFPSLLYSQRHLRYYHLQLRPYQQQNLQSTTSFLFKFLFLLIFPHRNYWFSAELLTISGMNGSHRYALQPVRRKSPMNEHLVRLRYCAQLSKPMCIFYSFVKKKSNWWLMFCRFWLLPWVFERRNSTAKNHIGGLQVQN